MNVSQRSLQTSKSQLDVDQGPQIELKEIQVAPKTETEQKASEE
jgi:hypothetical protein